MKTATRGDKPSWLTTPANITTATVCRLSGLMATEGCEHAEVLDEDGRIERRSTVYTEYFVRGTQPTQSCDLHPTRGFFGAIASIFTGSDKPAPPRASEVTPAPPPAARPVVEVATAGEAAPEQAEPPKKKRGFWSRVFGVGRDKGDDRNDDDREGTGEDRGRDRKR